MAEFASECDATWESRKKLWQIVVLVHELSNEPEHWIDTLADIATKAGMKQRDILTTLASGKRRASKSGAVA